MSDYKTISGTLARIKVKHNKKGLKLNIPNQTFAAMERSTSIYLNAIHSEMRNSEQKAKDLILS